MENDNPFPSSVYRGELCYVVDKMKAYLQAFELWEVVETNAVPHPLRANPTIAQTKQHNKESAKKFKALCAIHATMSDVILTRIMACATTKEAGDKLKGESKDSMKTRQMQVLNLRRDFESLKMKDLETVKEFFERLLKVVNQIKILGEDLSDKGFVSKVKIGNY